MQWNELGRNVYELNTGLFCISLEYATNMAYFYAIDKSDKTAQVLIDKLELRHGALLDEAKKDCIWYLVQLLRIDIHKLLYNIE